jgi:UDP-N-acetylglucosamine 2-epimerase (non-hydrolysing)
MKLVIICGARPNFMKVAPIIKEMKSRGGFELVLVHTGQHYDSIMSGSFFEDLGIPRPDVSLDVGSASHAIQTAKIMTAFEPVIQKEKPDLILVVGDVNSTIACALVAKKLGVCVVHVEAGLRSGDREMPEEINRLATDAITDYFFTTDPAGGDHLTREGVASDRVVFAGNVMIDTLLQNIEKADTADVLVKSGLSKGGYGLVTLHRPSNVDVPDVLEGLLEALKWAQERIPLLFPAHPRTLKMIKQFGFEKKLNEMKNLHVIEPLAYHPMLKACKDAKFVLTDSGGVQEESTVLGVPCITARNNTERPITVEVGTNEVVGTSSDAIIGAMDRILKNKWKKGSLPPKWDGKASQRIVDSLIQWQQMGIRSR